MRRLEERDARREAVHEVLLADGADFAWAKKPATGIWPRALPMHGGVVMRAG